MTRMATAVAVRVCLVIGWKASEKSGMAILGTDPFSGQTPFRDTIGRALTYKRDKLGNVVALLGNDGHVVEKYSYDAFGKPTVTDSGGNGRDVSLVENRFMFTGREWIAELGIYDYRNRFYHPELGRFLQVDPIGFDAGDMNLFRYCGDDPVDRTDPLGLYWDFLPDQFPKNFDNIKDITGWSKRSNGYTSRPVFSPVASIVPAAGEGYAIKYHDVNIKSQSYVRTHQRPSIWSEKERQRISEDIARTMFHEGRQRRIDRSLYKQWHKDGTFQKMIEGTKIYSDPERASEGLQENTKSARGAFESSRREQGRKLQQRDGWLQQDRSVPLGMIGFGNRPSAAEVDRATRQQEFRP